MKILVYGAGVIGKRGNGCAGKAVYDVEHQGNYIKKLRKDMKYTKAGMKRSGEDFGRNKKN